MRACCLADRCDASARVTATLAALTVAFGRLSAQVHGVVSRGMLEPSKGIRQPRMTAYDAVSRGQGGQRVQGGGCRSGASARFNVAACAGPVVRSYAAMNSAGLGQAQGGAGPRGCGRTHGRTASNGDWGVVSASGYGPHAVPRIRAAGAGHMACGWAG